MARRCRATSKQSGQRCKRFAIPGGTVCNIHGGGAPQVQQAAKDRLAALVDPAITRLGELVQQTEYPSTAFSAVKDVLDRNGLKAVEESRHDHRFPPVDEHESDEELLTRMETMVRIARGQV